MKKVKLAATVIIAAVMLVAFQVVFSGGVVPWFRISDSTANQSRPGLAYNSSSNQFLVVWEDFRAPVGFGSDVYAQLVNGDGSMAGVNIPVSTVSDWQRSPKAAYNPVTGKYLVVWEDWRIDLDDNIYAQLVNANGTMAGSEFTVSTGPRNQSFPDVAYNSSSNQFLVVFDDDRLVAYDNDIYGKLVNADGSMSGLDFPISTPSENQLTPVVAYNSTNNQFLVVWWDKRNQATNGADIYARLLNADGSMDGSDFPISTTSNAEQRLPAVAYDPDSNQYLVVWEHIVYDSDIYGRLIHADKSFVGSEFPISSGSYAHSDPAVAFDTNKNQFLVAWSDSEGWDNIHARLVNADGSMDGPKIDFATGKGDFFYPDMAFNSLTKQFLVVWRHQTCFSYIGCEDNDTDIYGAIYPTTTPTATNTVTPASTATPTSTSETVNFGLYLPLVLRGAAPAATPTHTATPVAPIFTPTITVTLTSTPTPTNIATPIITPTATNTATPTSIATPTSTIQPWVTILSEDFEGIFPGDWTLADENPVDREYYWGKRTCQAYAGSYSGWAVGGGADGDSLACGSNYPDNVDSWMVYGPFSLSDATAAELRYKAWLNTENTYDKVCPLASTDGDNFSGSCIWGDSSGWIDQVMDLTDVYGLGDLTGQPNVWVALWFQSDSTNNNPEGVFVDDILLQKCTSGGCSGSSPDLPDSNHTRIINFPAVKSLDLP